MNSGSLRFLGHKTFDAKQKGPPPPQPNWYDWFLSDSLHSLQASPSNGTTQG